MASCGRPRSFDRDDEALERAMELFWGRGYEAVTLEDLQEAMGGIKPPSFYAAFGSKEELFVEAIERYRAKIDLAYRLGLHVRSRQDRCVRWSEELRRPEAST